ncbi:HTH-type transcriptional regulator SarZ [compost metagenome]
MKDPRYPISQEISLLPVFRAFAIGGQRLERMMTRFMQAHDLTPAQFDVLATLGDTEGLPFKTLSQQALVTGGTLTPVLNRMEAKGLLRRCKDERDHRQVILKLTPEGQALYEATFLPYVDHAQAYLDVMSPEEQQQLAQLLDKLSDALLRPVP